MYSVIFWSGLLSIRSTCLEIIVISPSSWRELILILSCCRNSSSLLSLSMWLGFIRIVCASSCGSHDSCDVNRIALSTVHDVTILWLLICNYSTHTTNSISRTGQIYHLNWTSQWLHSSVSISACSLPADIGTWSTSTGRGHATQGSVCWTNSVLANIGRWDCYALQVLRSRARLGSLGIGLIRATKMPFSSSGITWGSGWTLETAFSRCHLACAYACTLLLARISAFLGFMPSSLLLMMLLLHLSIAYVRNFKYWCSIKWECFYIILVYLFAFELIIDFAIVIPIYLSLFFPIVKMVLNKTMAN